MKKVRDQQRSKVYKWEQSFRDTKTMPLEDCAALIKKAVNHYNLRMPRVADGRGCRRALYAAYKYTITLPKWARTPEVTLHETAHLVADTLFLCNRGPAHGREFVGVFMYLLSKYAGYDIKELAKSANKHGVDFLAAANCKPPRGK